MPRTHRSVVFLCMAAVALAAFFPSGLLDYAVLEIEWTLAPDPPAVVLRRLILIGEEQLASLLSVLPSRAPPAPTHA
jgi:hypothetical protein